jgi:hypothetical protein
MASGVSRTAVRHVGPLALFAILTVAWTWPLAAHPGDAIPGAPGDNYSFLWNLWWARTALDSSVLPYFRTTFLFYPFGVDMVGQSHVLGPGLFAATVLRPLPLVLAHNVMLFAFVFLNMACAYALAWNLTRHVRASVLAGLLFGQSPYLAAHLVGHFELMAAWPLPLFVLLLRCALDPGAGSTRAAFCAALVAVATTYMTYYYVIYLGAIAIVLVAIRLRVFRVHFERRPDNGPLRRARIALAAAMAALLALAAWIARTGGIDKTASLGISMTQPQNTLSAMWILGVIRALCTWRISIRSGEPERGVVRAAVILCAVFGAVFLIGAAPLLREAANVITRGEYVSQKYFWRSAPRGVDLVAPLVGPPNHPLTRDAVHALYAAMHMDPIEAVGWIGVVLMAILVVVRSDRTRTREWWMVAGVFGLFALGPILTIGGFDSGLRLPAILLRYVPIVSNARMPGRMMVVVFLALSAIAAIALAGARGRWASPGVQSLIIALLVFESWDAPIPITLLDRPAVYEALAQQPPGAVCEVPFGIGDGLSTGVGSQERSVLYYATIHRHPLVGGVVSRMPVEAEQRYEQMPVVGALLRLSSGRPAPTPAAAGPSPCRYLIVRRNEVSPELVRFVEQLAAERIASDDQRTLLRLTN